ncbi:MAG: hypothetical protein AB8G05_08910 [Oligoflexales bacterium]
MLIKSFASILLVHHEHDLGEPHNKEEHAHIIFSGFSFYKKLINLNSITEESHEQKSNGEDAKDHQHPFLNFICPHCAINIRLGNELPILSQWEQDELIHESRISEGFTSSILKPPIYRSFV